MAHLRHVARIGLFRRLAPPRESSLVAFAANAACEMRRLSGLRINYSPDPCLGLLVTAAAELCSRPGKVSAVHNLVWQAHACLEPRLPEQAGGLLCRHLCGAAGGASPPGDGSAAAGAPPPGYGTAAAGTPPPGDGSAQLVRLHPLKGVQQLVRL
eukprot:74627-Chlamydomonas_euryale.AAC.21